MGISPVLLFKILYYSFFFGIFIGIANDLNKAIVVLLFQRATGFDFIKKIIGKCFDPPEKIKSVCLSKTRMTVVFFQDVLLSIVYICGLIFLNYSFNNGTFRLFSVPASLLGVIMYHFTAGKIIDKILCSLCNIIKSFIFAVVALLFCPFLYFLRKTYTKAKKSFRFLKKTIAKCMQKRYNKYMKNTFTKRSFVAFLNPKELGLGDCDNETEG